jgi:cyclase
MERFARILFSTAALCLGLSVTGQDRFAKTEIKVTHVAGSVYLLEGAGGNIGISAGDDGVLIIDSQFAPLSGRIEAAIDKLGKGKPKFFLNTHWHGDHTGGNAHFAKQADIIAHKNVRRRMAADSKVIKGGLPVITFDQNLTLNFNGDTIEVRHQPKGHTDGDSVVVFTKAKVVHLGDHFFSGRFPYIDVGSGGDPKGYLANVNRLLATVVKADTKIIPGHGPLSNRDELATFSKVIAASIDFVEAGIEAGQSKAQIKSDKFWNRYQDWGWAFINQSRWVDILHGALSQ